MKQTAGIGARLFFWWADHPGAQLAVFVAMSTLATIGFTNPALITDLIPEAVQQADDSGASNRSDRRDMDYPSGGRVPDNVQPFQVGGGQCVLVARVDPSGTADLFTGSHLRAMRRVAEGLQSMPQIDNVMWLDSVPGFNLFGLSGTLLPSDNASQRQLDEARSRVLENPLAVGQLISQDGRTVLMHLGIDWFFVTSDEAVTS